MCGGLGFLIGAIIYARWRKSESLWKKAVAYICAAWIAVSVLCYAAILGGY